MPIYEYLCSKCGEKFEKIQKFSDEPLHVHEAEGCGGAVERLISTSALQFKGSGFYITDYAKGGTSPKSSGESKSESKGDSSSSDSKGESKSESKSEGKSESKSESKSSDSSSSSKSTESKPVSTKSD